MSEHYTDEDVNRASEILINRGWGWSPDAFGDIEAVLDAVAPTIAARARRDALEGAAANATRPATRAWLRLLARAVR